MKQISVIIPVFNRSEALKRTLIALSEQTMIPSKFEVIIVDDGSKDGLCSDVQKLETLYCVKFLKQLNKGPGAARNLGAKHAKANIFVFLDADMIPISDLLEHYSNHFVSNPRSIVIGRQLPWKDAYSPTFAHVFHHYLASDPGPENLEAKFYYLASGNIAIDRSTFNILNGFDDKLLKCEDVDLGYRAYSQGIPIYYEPKAIAYHNHPKTPRSRYIQEQSSAWWTARLMHKHPTLHGKIPSYILVEPIKLDKDSISLIRQKIFTRILVYRIPLALLKVSAFFIEKVYPNIRILRYIQSKILTSYRYIGFRAGYEIGNQ